MASKEAKIVRRAEAMSELQRLSALLAEHLEIELPDVGATHRDPELGEIQRIEAINQLLNHMLTKSGVDTVPEVEASEDLSHMKKAELLERAESKGVEVSKSLTKAEIIEAIENKEG